MQECEKIMTEKKTYYCTKCGRTMDESNFYSSNNLEKYPNGKLNICKKCLTMHMDYANPDTYLWALQEIDIPYVPEKWQDTIMKCQLKGAVTSMTVLGKYISVMKLKQWKPYRWEHTEILREKAQREKEQAMREQGFAAADIALALEEDTFVMPTGELRMPDPPPGGASFEETAEPESSDLGFELTEEDRLYLRLKWGKNYKPDEWVSLEKLYNEMMDSYDIQTAGHIDTLKLICKTSLKANQLIDINDIEGYQKMSKVYDQLMKAGKFTAAQNKAEQGEYIDSISELVAICEKDGFIPRYYTDGPQDKVDKVLLDMQKYTHDLVTEEMGLGTLIENAIKKVEQEREGLDLTDSILDDDDEEIMATDALMEYDSDIELKTEDFQEFEDFEETLEDVDDDFFKSLEEDGIL